MRHGDLNSICQQGPEPRHACMQAVGAEGSQEASALQNIRSWAGSSIQRLSFRLLCAGWEG